MMGLLQTVGWSLLYMLVFWYLYVLIMGLYRAHLAGRLTPVAFVLALPALVIGYSVDLLFNWTLFALLFWEWPKKARELVTDRFIRYVSTPSGWRGVAALWVCQNLLDYFDPSGQHCVRKTQTDISSN